MSAAAAVIGKTVLAAVRVALGAVFVWAGAIKLADPQGFAYGIEVFHVLDRAPWLIPPLAFVIPWAEVLSGALLVVGSRPRLAALVQFVLLAAFTGGYVWVLVQHPGEAIKCPCFGEHHLACGDAAIGACHLIFNGSLMAGALLVAIAGGGLLGLDGPGERRASAAVPGDTETA